MLAICASASLAACAQKTSASKVPAIVKASFEKKYPGVAATWEKEDGNYEVNFKKDGNIMSVILNADGAITETETDIKISDLPSAASTYVKAHYNGKHIKESAKIIKEDGTVNYEANVAGTDVIFDADGKFLREAKD